MFIREYHQHNKISQKEQKKVFNKVNEVKVLQKHTQTRQPLLSILPLYARMSCYEGWLVKNNDYYKVDVV